MAKPPQENHPTEPLTIDLGRVKCLVNHLKESLAEWAEAHDGTQPAEIGHALLYVMFDAGRSAGLEAQILAALVGPEPQAQPLTKAAKTGGFDA